MSEWWKSLSGKFNLLTPPTEATETLSLRDRLEREKDRQRIEARQRASGEADTLAPGESIEQAQIQDIRALCSLLGWKLGVKTEPSELTGNPSKVDGYWFGVKRYWDFATAEGQEDQISWKLHFFKPCNHCRTLVPTIELGDFAEVRHATERMMDGEEIQVARATSRLAGYLNDMEAGRPDLYCPRICPSCRKLIKGGTL